MPASADYPPALEELIGHLKRLPGIGRRGAERLTLALLREPPERLRDFGTAIASLPDKVTWCPACGNITEQGGLCRICTAAANEMTKQRIRIHKSGL